MNKEKIKFSGCAFSIVLMSVINSNSYAENYSISNPVPRHKMNTMVTEKLSATASSFTVDAGHVQVETSLYSLTKNNDRGVKTRKKTALSSSTARLGLTESSELSITTTPLIWQKTVNSNNQTRQNVRVTGETEIQYKKNLMGNDPDKGSSFALIPQIKIPTNDDEVGNDSYEGGLGAQFDHRFKNETDISYLFVVEALKKSDDSSYVEAFTSVFATGKSLNDKTYIFAELAFFKSMEEGTSAENSFNFGAKHAMTKNFAIGIAANYGISSQANDFRVVSNASYRF